MKSHKSKEAFSRPVKMTREDFSSESEVVKDRPESLDLKLAFKKIVNAWAWRIISRVILKNQRVKANYHLNTILSILFHSSDLLKYWGVTHNLNVVIGMNLLKYRRDSQAGHMFRHSHHWFWSAQTLESNSQAVYIYHQWFWSAQTLPVESQLTI